MTKNATGWGDWHTSSDIDQPCPQGCGQHTVNAANDLNQAESARRKAGLRAAHERWLTDGKGYAHGSSKVSGSEPKAQPSEAWRRVVDNANTVR